MNWNPDRDRQDRQQDDYSRKHSEEPPLRSVPQQPSRDQSPERESDDD